MTFPRWRAQLFAVLTLVASTTTLAGCHPQATTTPRQSPVDTAARFPPSPTSPMIDAPTVLMHGALVVPDAGLVVIVVLDGILTVCGGRPASHLEAVDIATGQTRWQTGETALPIGVLGDDVIVAAASGALTLARVSLATGARSQCTDATSPLPPADRAAPSVISIRWSGPRASAYVTSSWLAPRSCSGVAVVETAPIAPEAVPMLDVEVCTDCSFTSRITPMTDARTAGSPWEVRLASGLAVRMEDLESTVVPANCRTESLSGAAPSDECLWHHTIAARRTDGSLVWQRVWSREPKWQTRPP